MPKWVKKDFFETFVYYLKLETSENFQDAIHLLYS